MSEPLTVATITIVRVLGDDGDNVYCESVDPSGESLPLVEALGLLRLAEDTVIRQAMGEVPEGGDEE